MEPDPGDVEPLDPVLERLLSDTVSRERGWIRVYAVLVPRLLNAHREADVISRSVPPLISLTSSDINNGRCLQGHMFNIS
ncbi:Dystonin [Dissostichus eleginoides]|uniref:Dystonin n=1 Tax=Dissostichus eleginoides TaxID=100907 RepID=A0AAD9EV39_DISEL|nr:Dystonin [Dissostichus eleginoides]